MFKGKNNYDFYLFPTIHIDYGYRSGKKIIFEWFNWYIGFWK